MTRLVGNDIIWLDDPQNKGKFLLEKFVKRIFSEQEQKEIFSSACPDNAVWSLWAAKESAYKVAVKIASTIFSPKCFEVMPDKKKSCDYSWKKNSSFFATVSCFGLKLHVTVELKEQYVYAVASNKIFLPEDIISGVISVNEYMSSSELRYAAINEISRNFSFDCSQTKIIRKKIRGQRYAPLLLLNDMPANIDISLTHDGPFGAFAFPRQLLNQE